MGFDEGRIILDSENGAYYSGQTVFGRIVFDQEKPKTIHGIYVSCKGFCKVHWTTTRTRRVNKRTHTETIHHESYEEYFKRKTFVIGDNSGEHNLHKGHHEFHFSCPIPNNCPSSFEGDYGHIRYRVKVVMVTAGILSFNKEKIVAIRVHAPLDLNENPYCKEPIEFELNDSYCCWCISAGSSEIQVKLPVGGYCAGQVIPMDVSAMNHSNIDIDELKFSIKQNVKFHATTNPATKHVEETVVSLKKGPIPANTTRNWQLEMEVPAMDVYNFNGCRYIDIDYAFKVSSEPGGCHDDSEEIRPIIFGTIPLVGFQDTVQNPLHDQMPKPIGVQNAPANSYPPPPITTQPHSSYPIGTFPNENQNFIGASSSTALSKRDEFYGPSLAPYPPVPTSMPHPSNTAFGIGANANPIPTYPISESVPSYPTNIAVLPNSSGSFAPRYPTDVPVDDSVPPYPPSNQNTSSMGLLKTGTIGFAITSDGDSSKSPSMSPSSNVPYPTTPATNPYATASAPEPSTPDSDCTTAPADKP